jgi:hypothetical protein
MSESRRKRMPLDETLDKIIRSLDTIEDEIGVISQALVDFRNETPVLPPIEVIPPVEPPVIVPPQATKREDLKNPPPERSSSELANLRNSPGTPIPDGIYRLTLDRPQDPAIHIPGGVTLRAQNPKKVWLLLSRNWAPGGEAGVSWNQASGYWTSSRSVPNIGTNEPGGVSYEDQAKALRYEMCVGVTSNGDVVRFSSIAAGGVPNQSQFCLEGSRKIRLGRNPADFKFLEVCEAPAGPGRWFWPDGDGVTVEGLVMRYAPSGPSADPAGSHDRHDFTVRNCVIGDVHGTALNCGGSRNVRVEGVLLEFCGNSGMTTYRVDGLHLKDLEIYDCGYGGWDVLWQGGATKFTVTTNHDTVGVKIDRIRGSGLWWDESNTGPISVEQANVRGCAGPSFHYEISTGPVTVKNSLFAYNTFAPGWPVFYISSSTGPGDISDVLVIAGPSSRGLQAYWAQDRSNDKIVRDWHWHDMRFITEGGEAAVFIGGGAEGQSNKGSMNQYHFYGGPRWTAGQDYRDLQSWNASRFEEGALLVDRATADGWRAKWNV